MKFASVRCVEYTGIPEHREEFLATPTTRPGLATGLAEDKIEGRREVHPA
jgi:hypothetical protein